MEKLLNCPNLPERTAKKVIISYGCEDAEINLNKLGIECIRTSLRTNVRKGIMNHPDVHFCQLDNSTVIISSNQNEIKKAIEQTAGDVRIFVERGVKNGFPNEALLNCVFLDNAVIYNDKTISPIIKDRIEGSNLKKITVTQGYTKCSCAVVLNNAIITDDLIISKKVIEQGIDCLLVKKGHVRLKGYDYGFIGGCCGKISRNIMAFNGELKYHPDEKRIISFLEKHDVEPLYLKQGELEDIGSIIPLTE